MSGRGFYETLHDFLEAVKAYEKPTRITQLANMNWRVTRQYIAYALKHDMITEREQGTRKFYSLTPFGKYTLEALNLIPRPEFD